MTGAFANQVGLVTGASSGIGRAIALALAAQGASLLLVGRNLEALEKVAQAARQIGVAAQCYQADLTVDADVRTLASRVEREGSRLDLLILSAGVIALGRIESAPVEEFDRQYQVNVRAPYVLTQVLLPLLRRSSGQIVFINSSAVARPAPKIGPYGATKQAFKVLVDSLRDAIRPNRSPVESVSSSNFGTPTIGPYGATKHALKAIADTLRKEVNGDGVRILSVYPDRTASGMQASIHQKEGSTYHPGDLMQPEEVAATVLKALCLPRSAGVTDVGVIPSGKSV